MTEKGAKIVAYDPIAMESAKKNFDGEFELAESANDACKDADALLIVTEWNEFRFFNWEDIYKVMRKPSWIFDSRISLDQNHLKKIGFKVWTLGTP